MTNPRCVNDPGTRWALLMLDYQHDFLDQAGKLPVAATQVPRMLASTSVALNCALVHNAVVVQVSNAYPRAQFIRNLLRRGAAVDGTPGASWDSRVACPAAVQLSKSKASAFSNPNLRNLLHREEIVEVVLAGVYARACVAATVKSALGIGFRVTVLQDALACRDDRSRARATTRMAKWGAHVTTVDEFVSSANGHCKG